MLVDAQVLSEVMVLLAVSPEQTEALLRKVDQRVSRASVCSLQPQAVCQNRSKLDDTSHRKIARVLTRQRAVRQVAVKLLPAVPAVQLTVRLRPEPSVLVCCGHSKQQVVASKIKVHH